MGWEGCCRRATRRVECCNGRGMDCRWKRCICLPLVTYRPQLACLPSDTVVRNTPATLRWPKLANAQAASRQTGRQYSTGKSCPTKDGYFEFFFFVGFTFLVFFPPYFSILESKFNPVNTESPLFSRVELGTGDYVTMNGGVARRRPITLLGWGKNTRHPTRQLASDRPPSQMTA